jgi:hypothetical protein
VYVSNFEFDTPPGENSQASRGPIRGMLQGGLLRRHEDPTEQAQEAASLIAESLTEDLKKSGIDARRALPGTALPQSGWNVHGVFLSTDQGSTAKRAIIGFGAGRSNVQVAVTVDDLAAPGHTALQDLEEGSGSKMPGAILKLNPYVIAAKVVLAGHDQQKAIKNAAKDIAQTIVKQVQADHPQPAASDVACPSGSEARHDSPTGASLPQ